MRIDNRKSFGTTWTETQEPADLSVIRLRQRNTSSRGKPQFIALSCELVEPFAKPCDFGFAPLLENFCSGAPGALARTCGGFGLNRA